MFSPRKQTHTRRTLNLDSAEWVEFLNISLASIFAATSASNYPKNLSSDSFRLLLFLCCIPCTWQNQALHLCYMTCVKYIAQSNMHVHLSRTCTKMNSNTCSFTVQWNLPSFWNRAHILHPLLVESNGNYMYTRTFKSKVNVFRSEWLLLRLTRTFNSASPTCVELFLTWLFQLYFILVYCICFPAYLGALQLFGSR